VPEASLPSGTRRLFLALDVPVGIREELGRTMREMRSLASAVRYVSEDKLHMTLKFLGSVEDARVGQVGSTARSAAIDFRPFEFHIRDLGAFPNESRPRILWAGFRDSGEALALQARLEESLAPLGFPKEARPFRAHLTIGRVKMPAKMTGLMQWLDRNRDRQFGGGRAQEIVLYESRLRPEGPLYVPIERCAFRDG
jgi:RNA 2',3'-cyclic 3'-phosphodiesterase